MTFSHLGHSAFVDAHRDRTALGEPVPYTAEELRRVGLEAHPRAAAEAEPAAGELLAEVGRGDLDAGHHALHDGDERGSM